MYIIAIRGTTGEPVRDAPRNFYQKGENRKQRQTPQASVPFETGPPSSKGDQALDISSPYTSFQSPQAAPSAPLCPSLFMPKSECCFAVPIASLSEVGTEGDFEVLGISGHPLLAVRIQQVRGGRELVVSMAQPNGSSEATIGPPAGGAAGCGELEIRSCGNALHGRIVPRKDSEYLVTREGIKDEVMIISGKPGSLQLEVTSADRQRPLASVACRSEGFHVADHLEIRVHQEVDSVLVLSCVLAVILLF